MSGSVQDLANKRREYLRKKAGATGFMVFALFFCAASPAIAIMVVLRLMQLSRPLRNLLRAAIPALDVPSLPVVMLVSVVLVTLGIVAMKRSHQKRTSIPYVPPVAEQIAAMPAEAILVRGSDQPVAGPGELLRAAREGTETGSEELLRPMENVK